MTADKIFKKVIAHELYGPDSFMCLALKNALKFGIIAQDEYDTGVDAIKELMVNCLKYPSEMSSASNHEYPPEPNTIAIGNLTLSGVLEDCGFAYGQFFIYNLYNDWDNRFDGRLNDHKPTVGDHLSPYGVVRRVLADMESGEDLKATGKRLVAEGRISQQEYIILQTRYNYSLNVLIETVETQVVITNGFIEEIPKEFKKAVQELYDNFTTITIKDALTALTDESPVAIEARSNEMFRNWNNRFDLISSVNVKKELL